MAFLRVVQGGRPGELHEIVAERLVLGRHPSCEVVLDNAVISRQHARLIRQSAGYVIEDLGSRNGTYVNGKAISGTQLIRDRDHIRICDYVLEYLEQLPLIDEMQMDDRLGGSSTRATRTSAYQRHETLDLPEDNPDLESSSIITTLNAAARGQRLDVRPEVKLRAVLDLSRQLSQTVDLRTMLNQSLGCLFQLFPQAEYGIVVLCDADFKHVELKVARSRSGEGEEHLAISRTILQRALQSHEAILSEDLADDTRFRDSHSASALEIRSMMCAPLSGANDEPFGAIQLTTRNLKKIFTQDDLDLLVSVAAQAGLAVENTRLHSEAILRNEMERDLEVATQIQLGFLPEPHPSFPGYEFCHYYKPAAGRRDYYDYIPPGWTVGRFGRRCFGEGGFRGTADGPALFVGPLSPGGTALGGGGHDRTESRAD
ncbi:MAG: FHA domain-containing protein [Planctomycetaceae bacterium]